jgi:hypothetical protein
MLIYPDSISDSHREPERDALSLSYPNTFTRTLAHPIS